MQPNSQKFIFNKICVNTVYEGMQLKYVARCMVKNIRDFQNTIIANTEILNPILRVFEIG